MVDDMKVKFYDEVRRILSDKRSDNNAFLSTEEYKLQIDKLKKTKAMFQEKGTKKSMTHYRIVRKFDILKINGTERLIQPLADENSTVLQYVSKCEQANHSLHKILSVSQQFIESTYCRQYASKSVTFAHHSTINMK